LNYSLNRTYSSAISGISKTTTPINLINSIALNTSNNKIQNEYKCPSKHTFKIPLNDIKINDVLIKHELKLPQLRNQIELIDPLLHIEKSLPQSESINSNVTYECNRPLYSVLKYRSRHMNRKKKKKFLVKMKFELMKRDLAKQKRYENLTNFYQQIFEKKTKLFDPTRLVNREIEKAKFYGYKVSEDYDQYRMFIKENMKTFDEKYFRKFDDIEYANFTNNKRTNSGRRMPMGFNYTREGKFQIYQPRKAPRGFDPIQEALKKLEEK
jgi:hypothetical protein